MSGKESKRSPYWLRERSKVTYNVKKSKLEQQADTSNQNKHKTCSFVKKCRGKAQKKKTKEIKSKSSKKSMRNSHSGMKNIIFSF